MGVCPTLVRRVVASSASTRCSSYNIFQKQGGDGQVDEDAGYVVCSGNERSGGHRRHSLGFRSGSEN